MRKKGPLLGCGAKPLAYRLIQEVVVVVVVDVVVVDHETTCAIFVKRHLFSETHSPKHVSADGPAIVSIRCHQMSIITSKSCPSL